MREFSTATRRNHVGVPNAVDIEFKLDDDVMTAHAPTSGQVALFIQHGRSGGISSVTSLFEFFSDILDDDDWRKIEVKMRDGMDVELLASISNYLIGEWSGRPTTLSSASSPTPERYWPEIDGEAASQGGTDYLALPLDRFLNAIQWWVCSA